MVTVGSIVATAKTWRSRTSSRPCVRNSESPTRRSSARDTADTQTALPRTRPPASASSFYGENGLDDVYINTTDRLSCLCGGRTWTRTTDLCDVNAAL